MPFGATRGQHVSTFPGALERGAETTPEIENNRCPAGHYHGNISTMALAQSKLTAQGQISVPAAIRQRLGVGPGSVIEWDEDGGNIVVRRAGRYSSADVHRSLFAKPPKPRTLVELNEAAGRYVKRKHARR